MNEKSKNPRPILLDEMSLNEDLKCIRIFSDLERIKK